MIIWLDGREFEVDRVLDVSPTYSEAGGTELRYRVRIMGHERNLFYTSNHDNKGEIGWFVESRNSRGGEAENG